VRTILISGGSDGLGRAVAQCLASANRVVILSPSLGKLQEAAQTIGCEYKVCDVRNYTQVERIVAEVGSVDCVINSAGIWIEGPLDENNPERIKAAMDVNAMGTINLTKAVVPGMKQKKSGLIVNVISTAGLYAKPERSIYDASKWAITGFTKALQTELEPYHIRVTGLYPYTLNTKMFAKAGHDKDTSGALDTKDVASTIEFILNADNVVFPEIGMKRLMN
jgi:short-subunit dehydrogenase